MGRFYSTIDEREVIINYPIDESGNYLMEWYRNDKPVNGRNQVKKYLTAIIEWKDAKFLILKNGAIIFNAKLPLFD